MFSEKNILKIAKRNQKSIVFPEASFSNEIMEAAMILNKKKIVKVILLGDESALVLRYKDKLKGMTIINPKTSDVYEDLVNLLYEKRKDKGITYQEAEKLTLNPIYFGTLLVEAGFADGMVAGAATASKDVIKPALQIIKAKNKDEVVSSFMIFYGKGKILKNGPVFCSDVSLNLNPSAEQLAQIAKQTAISYKNFIGKEPKIAMLSYSTFGSGQGETIDKVKTATAILKQKTKFLADGEIQLDAAISPRVSGKKAPSSKINGQANVLVFPDLNSGNICYKAIQYFGEAKAIGPILQNLNKPINDLSRGCNVSDIILVSAITAIQA